MEADASTLDMPSDCCYFVEKAAAAGAAPAFQYFDSIFHHFAVVTQNLGQTHINGREGASSSLPLSPYIHLSPSNIILPTQSPFFGRYRMHFMLSM